MTKTFIVAVKTKRLESFQLSDLTLGMARKIGAPIRAPARM